MKIQAVSHPYLLPSSATCKPGSSRTHNAESHQENEKKRLPQRTPVDWNLSLTTVTFSHYLSFTSLSLCFFPLSILFA